jgi:antibiotic biosynthesis monooxygenase (ABM) superfamily enzyme
MTWLYARHPVANFEQWKPAFAATAVPRRKRFPVFAMEGNRNDVLMMEQFDTREDARAWVDSDEQREAMARRGRERSGDSSSRRTRRRPELKTRIGADN